MAKAWNSTIIYFAICICTVSSDNWVVLVQPVESASTMLSAALYTDLRQAHGQGSQSTHQSDTPRNTEPHLPFPWAGQAAGPRQQGQAEDELGVQRGHESDPLPQMRWQAAGNWHRGLHNTQPGREGGGANITGQRKSYGQNYCHLVANIWKVVVKQVSYTGILVWLSTELLVI